MRSPSLNLLHVTRTSTSRRFESDFRLNRQMAPRCLKGLQRILKCKKVLKPHTQEETIKFFAETILGIHQDFIDLFQRNLDAPGTELPPQFAELKQALQEIIVALANLAAKSGVPVSEEGEEGEEAFDDLKKAVFHLWTPPNISKTKKRAARENQDDTHPTLPEAPPNISKTYNTKDKTHGMKQEQAITLTHSESYEVPFHPT
ncbi:hypothetical protein BC829DRAFT_419345 [Chytridium lagenaria]|nr:hypothetical protein BC829DRAFT_419345 [Chytridium lagenaria]